MPFLHGVCIIASILGFLSHVAWFIHGEHDFRSRRYAYLYFATQLIGFITLVKVTGQSHVEASINLACISTIYIGSLFTSMAVYRLFFHRLRKYPGPLTWKLSKLAHVVANSDSMGYKHLDTLHKQYGDYVRIGPNELSIADPRAPEIVLGSRSKCTKAIWYDISKPLLSTHQCRDKTVHHTRRRLWDKALSASSLRDFEARVTWNTDILMDQIKRFAGQPFDASRWFNYFTLDVISSIAYGRSFRMLETSTNHFVIRLLEAAMAPMNLVPAAPWLFYMISPLPIFTSAYYKFYQWSYEQAARRKMTKVPEKDIMYHLLDTPTATDDPDTTRNWETGDSRLILLAGTDTTTSTLTHCIFELIRHPKALETLREELKDLIGDLDLDYRALQNCKHLNAVIDETLRLHPAVPSGFIRITPPEGLMIGETFVPGGTNITLPSYTIHRSPQAFEQPHQFIPERWYSEPHLVKLKTAFYPFSFGSFSCAGKGLAYMELRAALSKLVVCFDLCFASGEDGSQLIHETKDQFSLRLAPLNIVCTPRK